MLLFLLKIRETGNVHAQHHKIYVPYAFGAFYNTLTEAFILDTIGTTISLALSGLSTRQATLFATISVLKGVDDHCGYQLPWDPLQWFNEQNATFHDVHHQSWGAGVRIYFITKKEKYLLTKLTDLSLWLRQTTHSFILHSGIISVIPYAARAARRRNDCMNGQNLPRRRRKQRRISLEGEAR